MTQNLTVNTYPRLPDDHMVDLEQSIGLNYASWTLESSFLSWDLVNFIINDLTYSGLKSWLIKNQTLFENIIPDQKIAISTMVESSLETSKRFILQRYLSPGIYCSKRLVMAKTQSNKNK